MKKAFANMFIGDPADAEAEAAAVEPQEDGGKGPSGAGGASKGFSVSETREDLQPWKRECLAALKRKAAKGRHVLSSRTIDTALRHHDFTDAKLEHSVGVSDIGTELSSFGVEVLSDCGGVSSDTTCAFCENTFPAGTLERPCARPDCSGALCTTCMVQYLWTRIDLAPYAVPGVPCPHCYRRVPTAAWWQFAPDQMVDFYIQCAARMFTVACSDKCTPQSCFVTDAVVAFGREREAIAAQCLSGLPPDTQANIMREWAVFSSGGPVNSLIDCLCAAFKDAGVPRASAYPPKLLELVGYPAAESQFDAMGMQSDVGAPLLRLVNDLERRVTLQLGLYRRFPVLRYGCSCKHKMVCFKCKEPADQGGVHSHCDYHVTDTIYYRLPGVFRSCPNCSLGYNKLQKTDSILCYCGQYFEWADGDRCAVPGCWGGDTWAFTADGPIRMRDIRVGTPVRTASGQYRPVAAVWVEELSKDREVGEVVRFRNLWITSHHPVLVGPQWRFPADVAQSLPAAPLADTIGLVYNLELEGHEDTIVLAGDGDAPTAPLTVSCAIGKYLGSRFGQGIWTRRSTRCPGECVQCDAVYMPGINFSAVPLEARFQKFPEFPQVEYEDKTGYVEWGTKQVNAVLADFNIPAAVPRPAPPPSNLTFSRRRNQPLAAAVSVSA